jgi:hypothetical protein
VTWVTSSPALVALGIPARPCASDCRELEEQRARALAYIDTARRHRASEARP